MTTDEIIALQKRVGTTPDGFWGPASIAACQAHVRRIMPKKSPWPRPDEASMRSFYGAPGNEGNLITIDFPYPMFYDGKRVLRTRCHEDCAESLLRVLTSIGRSYGTRGDVMDEASDYGGIYNFRNSRGSRSLSKHAWGAAIDLDADDNTFRDTWPIKADMPMDIIEEFAREGWISAAVFWGYDAMHFQATQ